MSFEHRVITHGVCDACGLVVRHEPICAVELRRAGPSLDEWAVFERQLSSVYKAVARKVPKGTFGSHRWASGESVLNEIHRAIEATRQEQIRLGDDIAKAGGPA